MSAQIHLTEIEFPLIQIWLTSCCGSNNICIKIQEIMYAMWNENCMNSLYTWTCIETGKIILNCYKYNGSYTF